MKIFYLSHRYNTVIFLTLVKGHFGVAGITLLSCGPATHNLCYLGQNVLFPARYKRHNNAYPESSLKEK